MTRHARNATASSVYSYHEKQKDAKASGYGTKSMRISKDSVRDFDCCCLTLQLCRNPIVTPDGYLYDKEAILEYILEKKAENMRLMKVYESQKNKESMEEKKSEIAAKRLKIENFLSTEESIISQPINPFNNDKNHNETISNMKNGNERSLPSFWIPALTPQENKISLEKPSKHVYCPMSGKPIKAKDLIPIKFTEAPLEDNEKGSLISRKARYICAVSKDVLSNTVPCVVLKPSGDVITLECMERIIKKDMICPITGKKLNQSDIIPLQRGGTGFSAVNNSLRASVSRPVLQV